jgi:sugar phosphate isomerase/epimerase
MKHTSLSSSPFSRRNFLASAGAISAALAATNPLLSRAAEQVGASGGGASKKPQVGLELYSVRGEMGKDMPATLKAVADIGYRYVEYYSPYFKWTPAFTKDLRSQMDDLGLRCFSTHNGFESFAAGDNFARAVELNQILGCRYLVLASAPRTNGVDGWKKLCERLTAVVDELKPHGLGAGYHNHQAEWAKLENGQRIMEVMAANTPKEFALQLDVGTCEEAGVDPVAWVKANPDRIKMMHLKDWAPADAGKKDKGYRVLYGEGITPWKELLTAAETVGGVEVYYIEQEGSRFPEIETAKRCLENWKAIHAA